MPYYTVFLTTWTGQLNSLSENVIWPSWTENYELPWWLRGSSVCLKCGRPRFDPWVGKIPWRRKWQPTPVLLPGKFHGQRILVGYSPWGRKESNMTEWLHFHYLWILLTHQKSDFKITEKKRFKNMTLMLKRLKQKLKSMRKMLEIVFVKEMNPLTRGTTRKGQDLIRLLVKKSIFSVQH